MLQAIDSSKITPLGLTLRGISAKTRLALSAECPEAACPEDGHCVEVACPPSRYSCVASPIRADVFAVHGYQVRPRVRISSALDCVAAGDFEQQLGDAVDVLPGYSRTRIHRIEHRRAVALRRRALTLAPVATQNAGRFTRRTEARQISRGRYLVGSACINVAHDANSNCQRSGRFFSMTCFV